MLARPLIFFPVHRYFGGFYVYNWKVKNAEPGDRVPHKDFWMGLPDLIKVRTHVGQMNVYEIGGSGECV